MSEQEQELNEMQHAILREFKDGTRTKLDEFELSWVETYMLYEGDYEKSLADLVERGYLKSWKRRGVRYYRRL